MIKIEQVSNGYMLTHSEYGDGSGNPIVVIYQDMENEKQHALHAVQQMLSEIVDILGVQGTRYDKERIVVRLEPGDKYEHS